MTKGTSLVRVLVMRPMRPVTMSANKNMKEIECIFCKRPTMVDNKVHAVLCPRCVQHVVDPPTQPKPYVAPNVEAKEAKKAERAEKKKAKLEAKKTAKRGKGRGWHLKQLFEWEGQFYSFGKAIDDAAVAKIRKALKKAGK